MPDTADPVVFWHGAPSRSSTVHWMLEEADAPYETRLLDLKAEEQRQPAYLAVNPMGKVPAIQHRGVVVTEAPAICAYLADAFPAAGLAPAPDDPARGTYFRWLFFYAACIEPAVADRALQRPPGPRGMLGYGDFDTTLDVVAQAVSASPGPWLLGERFTAADVVIGSGLRWTMMFGIVPRRPEFTAYTDRIAERPALQRAEAKDAALTASRG